MSIGYIDDDYTLDGYIAASTASPSGARLWDALEFKYRVAMRSEWIYLDAQVNAARRDEDRNPECAVKAEELACEFVAKHLKEWNLKDRGNHEVKITAANLMKMHGTLFQKLYYIVRGDLMSDLKPKQSEADPTHEEQLKN